LNIPCVANDLGASRGGIYGQLMTWLPRMPRLQLPLQECNKVDAAFGSRLFGLYGWHIKGNQSHREEAIRSWPSQRVSRPAKWLLAGCTIDTVCSMETAGQKRG